MLHSLKTVPSFSLQAQNNISRHFGHPQTIYLRFQVSTGSQGKPPNSSNIRAMVLPVFSLVRYYKRQASYLWRWTGALFDD